MLELGHEGSKTLACTSDSPTGIGPQANRKCEISAIGKLCSLCSQVLSVSLTAGDLHTDLYTNHMPGTY